MVTSSDGQRLAQRLIAIREAAKRPTRDFNLDWQLGCLLNDIERLFGLRSSDLDTLIEPEVDPAWLPRVL